MKIHQLTADEALRSLQSGPAGLSADQAARRLVEFGPNEVVRARHESVVWQFIREFIHFFALILWLAAGLAFWAHWNDPDQGMATLGFAIVGVIVVNGVFSFWQVYRAERALAALEKLLPPQVKVQRGGVFLQIPAAGLIPGDVISLEAGDLIPADCRLIEGFGVRVNVATVTGESLPKARDAHPSREETFLRSRNTLLAGTPLVSGNGRAVVCATGDHTEFGKIAHLTQSVRHASFPLQREIAFLSRVVAILATALGLVFFLIGLTIPLSITQNLLFAIGIIVANVPEGLLPTVTLALAIGAQRMARRNVVIRHLPAVETLGSATVICTDKTGTLTMDRVILERYCDVVLKDDEGVLALAYMNSHFQTGLKNVLDRAVLAHIETHTHAKIPDYAKVDEIPFDFQRRVMSVVVRTPEGKDRIISKGAPEAIFPRCTNFELDGQFYPMDHAHIDGLKKEHERLSADGFRVLAIATKDIVPRGVVAGDATPYSKDDECELILNGYVAFLDPPKESATAAIKALQGHGVEVKVVTGDNDLVARKICKEVGLSTEFVLLGSDVEGMSDDQLADAALKTTLFARVSPSHKQRIIKALQSRRHTVGFIGDGINDAPALRAADVGISVDTAVDIAKESADMILLEKSLLVLEAGVVEGRKVFANILKYVRMGASSNFGNMFSVLGASVFVPFLPMAPIQILANNLLYDISQTAIPTDEVDPEQVEKPRPWDMKQLTRFIVFIGPCSSIFDYTTYFIMLYIFNCWNTSTPEAAAHSASLFQTGWFVESLLTQTLIIHIIRTNKIPFLQSRPSWPLLVMSSVIMAIGVAIPFTPLGDYLGFTPLPLLYWPLLTLSLLCYVVLTQLVKMWLLKTRWI